jgi:hypothetical protein
VVAVPSGPNWTAPPHYTNCKIFNSLKKVAKMVSALTFAKIEWRICRKHHIFVFYSNWAETVSLGAAATTGLVYQPQMIGDGDCGEIGGLKIGRGKRSTRRKPAPAPLCPPHD